MVQVRSIRKSVWAAVGVAAVLFPFTQKGFRSELVEIKKSWDARNLIVRGPFTQEELTEARINPYTVNGQVVAFQISNDPGYLITAEDKEFARAQENLYSEFTLALVKHKNYLIESEDVKIARNDPDSLFSNGAAQNETYPIEITDLKILRDKPTCNLALGLRKNPNLDAAITNYSFNLFE